MALFRKVEKIDYVAAVSMSEFIQDIAAEVLEEEQAKGFPKSGYITLVDNKQNKPVTQVKPLGKIEYLRPEPITDIALETLELLIKYSPVGHGATANKTGRYKEKHAVILNGQVLTGLGSLRRAINAQDQRIEQDDEIIIVNIQPYARKIERGLSQQSPSGVYKRVASIMKRKYGKIAFISQRYINSKKIPGLKSLTVRKNKGTRGGVTKYVEQVYPAIRIKRGRGTL